MKAISQQVFNAKEKLMQNDKGMKIQTVVTKGKSITVLYLDSMTDDTTVSNIVLQSLFNACDEKILSVNDLYSKVVFCVGSKIRNAYNAMMTDYLNGYCLLFVDGCDGHCLSVDARTNVGRSIVQPPTTNVTLGPREGFVENLKTNLTLLRKRIKSEDFRQVEIKVGKYTDTSVMVCYIDSITDSATVSKVVQKITAINIDGIIDASYVARFLDDGATTLFKMVGTTEKPDVVAGKMLEGRVAIFVDGSPVVLTVPYVFIEDVQSPEDYYDAPEVATMLRVLRIMSAVTSLLLPALYVSLQLHNYQIIPSKFLITILYSTQSIPFTPLTEMLLVLILFDILREANARMPSIAGLSLSIIGAVVLGDAAVRAGLLGAPVVMIGAMSGIGLYAMPDNTLLLTLLRLFLTFIGGIMGLLGLILSGLALISYLVSLESYGSPYLAPFAPNIPLDKNDAILKGPLTKLKHRPQTIRNSNRIRQGEMKNEK